MWILFRMTLGTDSRKTDYNYQEEDGYIQKKEGCHRDNQSFQLTLKSNTMKNTMQR